LWYLSWGDAKIGWKYLVFFEDELAGMAQKTVQKGLEYPKVVHFS